MMKVSLGGGYKTLNKEKIKRIVQEMDKVQERKREHCKRYLCNKRIWSTISMRLATEKKVKTTLQHILPKYALEKKLLK